MRGVPLDQFRFDYDLTWMGFFLAPDGRVLGRYGGRDADVPDGRLSLKGLRYAMATALEENKRPAPEPPRQTPRKDVRVDDYPGIRRFAPTACVHCHQVYELQREHLQALGKWTLDDVWVYPPPENVGLTLEVDRGDVVARVAPRSAADRAGLRAGDRLLRLNGHPVASFADAQFALDGAPTRGKIEATWLRDGKALSGTLELAEGWRRTDLSWRKSIRRLDPQPWVHGEDLTPDEKRALGLDAKRLAFRQGNFVTPPARQAGIRQNDVILGVDGKELNLTERQFGVYVRLNYKVGDKVTYNLLRDGKRVDAELTLSGR